MPNFARNLNQVCTYWAQTGTDMFNKPVFAAPQALACRWEEVSEKFINKNGEESVSKSRIFFAQNVDLEGYLFLGVNASADATEVDGAYEVQQVKKTPDLRGLKTLYVVYL